MPRAFEFVVLTPVAWSTPSIAIAASRAGALGVLDLEFVSAVDQALAAVRRLGQYAGLSFGVKISGGTTAILERLATETLAPPAVVIVAGGEADSLAPYLTMLRRRRVRIVMSVAGVDEAEAAEKLEVDAIIAKGHESGGWVGEETAFVLLQHLLQRHAIPVWVHGGIGQHTVAACYAAGASGVVLDSQLVLLRESPLPETIRATVTRMDGSETVCIGGDLGAACRIYARPRLPVLEELRQIESALAEDARPHKEKRTAWQEVIHIRVGWESLDHQVWPLGQDAAFAVPFAQQFRTVAGMLTGLRESIESHCRLAQHLRPLERGSALAQSHGTQYPIVQGPMTRVSDTPAFAESVANNGGLPFLALALLRGEEVKSLLADTARCLGDRPWGVGILGFVPLALRQEQLEAVRTVRPPFALIAGGRPDQALLLEQSGIPTYLHVPSPGLLSMFLESGAQRFVFEGRECGGHVGPRSSFVLWELMVNILLEKIPSHPEAEHYHVLFAGGIHDELSAAMVATLAAPLAARGVRVGVLLGTAYLFTTEAVESGAIGKVFQEEALQCQRTILLETGPGHATRCVETAFGEVFKREKWKLKTEQRLSPDEIRTVLEDLNLGRLRIASKGIARNPQLDHDAQAPRFVQLGEETQRTEGMYMIGQVAALRSHTCTIAELHHQVSVAGSERLSRLKLEPVNHVSQREARPVDIAIIGMACLLPKAPHLKRYWENILNKVDAITEVPPERWDWRRYYDPDPRTPDKVYSKWGGFIDAVPFDPLRYGMPPNTLSSIEPLQLLTLEVVRAALTDAGYTERLFPHERTGVILGVGGGAGDLGQQYAVRSALPMYLEDTPDGVWQQLPQWTEDSFAGILLNVVAGRVANRFDLGGVNYTVDAACASSLAAVYAAVRELETGTADMMVVGGADTVQNPFAYLCFSKTHALSPRGRCRPFDASADGIAISEGVAMLVLKRLEDAERDGDRIYAVIKAVAGSSDGRDRGLTAPRPEGQIRALERAYAAAGFGPHTVSLIEAHGTGTVAGDQAEVESLTRVFAAAGAAQQSCALGSVKSMIGHTKCTAGVAGIVKVALALHHRVLPPTLHIEQPNPKAFPENSPFYVNTEVRPWLPGPHRIPRRAGVSSFGFGGTNFHTVLEEYRYDEPYTVAAHWPTELFVWTASSRQEIVALLEQLEQELATGARPTLRDLAYSVWLRSKERRLAIGTVGVTLTIVATMLDDLRQKLGSARTSLSDPQTVALTDPRGVYFTAAPLAAAGQLAFLFPGQGSQSVDMLRDLAVQFPEVREVFTRADAVLAECFPQPLSTYIFPPPRFGPAEERLRQEALTQTHIAQPALGAAALSLLTLLRSFGVEPQVTAGHSYGEYIALCAAGVLDEETLFVLSEARGRAIIDTASEDLGTMAAVQADREQTAMALAALEGVWIANVNGPTQTMISGTQRSMTEAIRRLEASGMRARPIQVACGFHSPLVAPARDRFAAHLATTVLRRPRIAVFSNTLAAPHAQDPRAIATLLVDHLVQPVRFAEQIEAMYQAGVRLFVEVGPGSVLTNLVQQNLGPRAHVAIAPGASGRSALLSLQLALAQLAAHGVAVNLDRLFVNRDVRRLDLGALAKETQEEPLPATAWLVHGGRAWPAHEERAKPPLPVALSVTQTVTEQGENRPTAATADHIAAADGGRQSSPQTMSSHAASSQPPPVPLVNGGAAEVVLQFQCLMDRFLETQRNVMLTYLPQQPSQLPAPAQHVPQHVAPPAQETFQTTGHPLSFSHGSVPQNGTGILLSKEAIANSERRAGDEAIEKSMAGTTRIEEAAGTESSEIPAAELGRERLTQELLQIVSERTGYPTEMLDLDVNIEADLGIDSIKRVEILGAFQQAHLAAFQEITPELMENLTGLKTLRGIIDAVIGALNGASHPRETALNGPATSSPRSIVDSPTATPTENVRVPRFLLSAVEAPLDGPSQPALPQGPVMLTDDQRGVAEAIAADLRTRGISSLMVRHGAKREKLASDSYATDLTDFRAVKELIEALRHAHGPLGGIIHCLPLRDQSGKAALDPVRWRESVALHVKSLFSLLQNLGADIKTAAEKRAGCVVALTSMGGHFASDWVPEEFCPLDGGIAGIIKTLALEWPTVRCRVIDIEARSETTAVADSVLQELRAADSNVEIGYRDGRRFVLRARPASLQEVNSSRIDTSDIFLITGGARGITAEIACELAARYRPTILIAGRSALPNADEPWETATLSGRELKQVLIQQMSRAGQRPLPAQVETVYTRLLHEREVRQNLALMREVGATVRYHQVDVRDEQAFAGLIDTIYASYGRLDGVIHGAGLIEDKLLEDKARASFDRVFDTKVTSAFVLSHKLRPESLKFLVFFSSVAGRFGNRGQGDYAAANEVLNKLAVYLDHQWPARVVAIDWGPWGKTGMVSSAVERHFIESGVQVIPPTAGRQAFDEELRCGRKGEREVIWGDGPWKTAASVVSASSVGGLPLFRDAVCSVVGKADAIEVLYRLDPSYDLYLQDHQLDGKSVFPAAMAMELMAEVAQHGWPERQMVGVRSLRVLRGIVLEDRVKALRIIACPQTQTVASEDLRVNVEIRGMDEAAPAYYRATIQLSTKPAVASFAQAPGPVDIRPFPLSAADAYGHWLFHGPRFQGISKIEGINGNWLVALVKPSSPEQCVSRAAPGHWLIDPVVVDSGFQLAILWARAHNDMTPLPASLGSLRCFGVPLGKRLRCHLQAESRAGGSMLTTQLFFSELDGRLVGLIEDMEFSCSKSLNRLGGKAVSRLLEAR